MLTAARGPQTAWNRKAEVPSPSADQKRVHELITHPGPSPLTLAVKTLPESHRGVASSEHEPPVLLARLL